MVEQNIEYNRTYGWREWAMMEIGMVTAIAAAAMFFWYRPRWGEGAKLCALCFVMGLAGMFMGGCGPLLAVLEGLLAMVAGVCCLFSLHR